MLDQRGLANVELEVDGGVHSQTISEVVRAGATILVAGSAIFNRQGSVQANIQALRQAISTI
jgi:ribulose-phosphate 3-epimerase